MDYVVEAVLEVHDRRESLPRYRITDEPWHAEIVELASLLAAAQMVQYGRGLAEQDVSRIG